MPASKDKKNLDPIYAQLFSVAPSKGDLMKERILLSAIECIATKGIEETTFESIGKPLKIRKSHVAYHFKDKEDLIAAAIRYVIAKGQALTIEKIKDAKTPREKIFAIAEGFFDWLAKHPKGMSVYHLFYYYCTFNKDYRDLQTEIRQIGVERMIGLFKEDPDLSKENRKILEDLARNIQALGFGTLTDLITQGEMTPARIQSAKERALRAFAALIEKLPAD